MTGNTVKKMQRQLWAVIFFLFVGAAYADCTVQPLAPSSTQVAAAQQNAQDRGFLWRASKDGHSSYLYGTVHVAAFEWVFPGTALGQALRETDTLALELNPLDDALMAELQSKANGKTAQPLPQNLQARIRALADANCVPQDMMNTMRPELQLATLGGMLARDHGLEPAYGIDLQLAVMAKQVQRPIVSLETVDEQLAVLLDAPAKPALRNAQFDEALKDLESGHARSVLLKLASAWASSDLHTIATYATWCDCVRTAQERKDMKRMVDARNPVMATRIDRLHAQGKNLLVAVGTLHMVGPTGLPALLGKRGYTVEKVF